MDKKTLYEKAEKAINQAFEATKKSVKVVSEKAGEAAHITKLLIEKATLEHQVSKKFAQIGNRVYEKVSREGKSVSASDQTIKALIDETQKLDVELAQVEASLEKEKKEKKQASRK
jgi:Fe-S cluster biosynthesis and repair protein YggX